MKKMKKVLSCLLVFAMMIGLVPADLARAEGEDSEYNVYLSSYVQAEWIFPDSYSQDDFSVSVPEQDGVSVSDWGDGSWNVKDQFTFYITIPEECNPDCLSVCNNGVLLEDAVFVKVADNQYSVTIAVDEYMSLSVKDATWCYVGLDAVTPDFTCYVEDNYVRQGDSCKLYIQQTADGADITKLDITIDGESIDTAELNTDSEGVYFYTITATESIEIKVYEEGGGISLSVSDVPESGYEFYDGNGVACTIEAGWVYLQTTKNGTVTFQIRSSLLDYALYLDDTELTPAEAGENTYSYTVSDISWHKTITFKKKYKITSAVNIIPCTMDGTALSGYATDGVTEFWACADADVYFKLADTSAFYAITLPSGESVYRDSETKVYDFYMPSEDVALTAEEQYTVTIGQSDKCNVSIDNYDWSAGVAYTTGDVSFLVRLYSGEYNTDKMSVTLTGEDGTSYSLESGDPYEEYGDYVYPFSASSINQNVVIDVTGIYSTEPQYFHIEYDETDFKGVSIEVMDEEGNAIEKEEEWEGNIEYYHLCEAETYRLVLSSDTVDLSQIKVKVGSTELELTEGKNGSYEADIADVLNGTVYLMLGEKYYVTDRYATDDGDDDDDEAHGYLRIFGMEDEWIGGYHDGGELKFWIDADYGLTSENAFVTEILDGEGNQVAFTKEENVEVDSYGTIRTVYAVNVDRDITIYYSGIELMRYNVYLPIPSEEDGYTISDLQISYDDGDSYEDITGIADNADTYKVYKELQSSSRLKFSITVPSDSRTPLVSEKFSSYDDERTYTLYGSVDENADGSLTYTYEFSLLGTTEILVTTNTREIEVSVKDDAGHVEYNSNHNLWCIYSAEGILLAYIDGLPPVVDAADDGVYDFGVAFNVIDDGSFVKNYRLKKGKENSFLTAYNTENKSILLETNDYYYSQWAEEDCHRYSMPAGCYELVLDTSCIVANKSYIQLSSEVDGITIMPKQTEDAGYTEEDGYLIPDSDTLCFDVTAENAGCFDDMCIDWNYVEHDGEYEESNDGLTRTYKLTGVDNLDYDPVIRIAYKTTLVIQQGTNVSLSLYDQTGFSETDDDGTVINLPSGFNAPFQAVAAKGYDVDTITVMHKHAGGTDSYTVGDGNSTQDGFCDIVLQPGENIVYATEPEKKAKKSYKIDFPQSTAYTIEPVKGSTTTVASGGSFSFNIKANAGYDLSGITVTANGNVMTPDKNGTYTISNINTDYEISVTGYRTNSYTVTFKDYNGKVIGKAQTVAYGKNATAPAAPVRKGYTFAGWDKSFVNVKKDIVVTATYKPILVSKIIVTGDIVKLAAGKSVTLKTEVTPKDALDTEVTWSSSNNKYAAVTANGKVTAKKAGAGKIVTITATAKDGSGVKATYKIKIYKNAVKKIKLSAKSKSVKPGKKVKIKAKVSPSKSVNTTLKWSSSNTKYATVNSKGVVTTKKAGKGKTVIITAKATDGSNKKAIIKIKIKKK